jgi:hypothetical protein
VAQRLRAGDRAYSVDAIRSRGDRVVVAFSWSDREGHRHAWAHALRLRDGKIVDMQDFANPKSALALMRLRTALLSASTV